MKKWICLLLCACLLLPGFGSAAAGYQYIPYTGYTYDEYGTAIAGAVTYEPQRQLFGDAAGTVLFSKASDLMIYESMLAVLTPTSVILMDKNEKLIREIRSFSLPDGSAVELIDAKGLFIKKDTLIVADPELGMVLISDLEGHVRASLTKPENPVFPQAKAFRPVKVLADRSDNLYVLVDGIYQGAVTYNKYGEFLEFFGSNPIEMTASLLIQMFWRNFMTEEQIDASLRNVPVEYTNFDVDADGFIYTCTAATSNRQDELRKLNSAGVNIFPSTTYGDQESITYKTISQQTAFTDVAINEDGYLFAADATKGRIFQYDGEGEMISIFGGNGVQMGRFQALTAIDTNGRQVYALDSAVGAITVFEPTTYGQTVYEATLAYMDGEYQNSRALWEEVLMRNANCSTAYVGIGKALYLTGDYAQAMAYFDRGADRGQMSRAFAELRKGLIRRYVGIGITVLVCIPLAGVVVHRLRLRRKRKARVSGREA